jgi:hypothetical protein
MAKRNPSNWGKWALFLGLVMLAAAIVVPPLGLWSATKECPEPIGRSGASARLSVPEGGIRLGRPACLYLRPARFFAPELKASTQPQRRTVFLFFDDVRVPMEGREVEIRRAGRDEWIAVNMELRTAEDAASDDGRTWRKILDGPTHYGTRKVRVSVAVSEGADTPPIIRAVLSPPVPLKVFDFFWLIVGALGLALLTAGVVMRGWNTGLLRDGGPGTQFSLGRVQMGWWLVLTLGGFLFIWLVSGQWMGVVTSGVIGLLGISATTGVASRLVDTRGGNDDPASPPASPPEPPPASNGFWNDLVSDGDGAALHRLQLIAWTIVLGAVFAWTVVWTFGFPDFDTNLLLLAGIAGGTYLGFKFQEPDPPPGGDSPPS